MLAIVFISAAPATVFCQEQQEAQEIEQPTIDTRPVDVNTGTLNTSPWPSTGNSATDNNSSSGTVDRPSNTNTAARPGTSSAQRPAGSGTVLDAPGGGGGFGGGNPDVPFDDNMNIGFLVVGLVFAFVVYRKRFSIKHK